MATYKLIQNIEAEDKILGPLTLRQFIFALITAFLLYICFVCLTRGGTFLLIFFLPPAILTGFFAFPFGRDQPTEIWALGKLRFWFKPRRRIWDQSGMKELVTITVPKKIEHNYTDGLSQTEVQSRLKALAQTIDSRGWALKDVAVNSYAIPQPIVGGSDRLVAPESKPQEVPDMPVTASDDIMDEANNPIAKQFDDMINQASQTRRQQLVEQLKSGGKPPAPVLQTSSSPWFMPTVSGPVAPAAAAPSTPAILGNYEEKALTAQLQAHNKANRTAYSNLRTIRPGGPAPAKRQGLLPTTPAASATGATPAVTAPAAPAIMALANNDDLNVATIAREAQKAKERTEVVISLH